MCVCVCVCACVCVCVCWYRSWVDFLFELFGSLCIYIYTRVVYIFHYHLSQLAVPHFSPAPILSLLTFLLAPCLITLWGLCSCLSWEVPWCVSEQALYLPQLRTLSSGICTLELIHLTTRTPLPSKSFATVGQECLLEVYTWGTFVKHGAPLSSMGHLCQACGSFALLY